MLDIDSKFQKEDKLYFDYIKKIKKSKINKEDFIYHFPVFVGEVNLSRFILLYECYKKVQKLNGHIADIGTWKGASFFALAKFVKVFEKNTKTHVFGFDWFRKMLPGKNDSVHFKNKYKLSTDELILGIGFGVNSESKFFESMSKIDCEEIDYFFTVFNEKKQWK